MALKARRRPAKRNDNGHAGAASAAAGTRCAARASIGLRDRVDRVPGDQPRQKRRLQQS